MDSPRLPAEGNHDVATYLAFFSELLQRFEGAAAEFEGLIDEACRNLLEVAVQRLFSNLRRYYPAVDLEVITALETEDDQAREISRAVAGAVTAFVERFKRPTEGESSSEEDGEESEGAARATAPTIPPEGLFCSCAWRGIYLSFFANNYHLCWSVKLLTICRLLSLCPSWGFAIRVFMLYSLYAFWSHLFALWCCRCGMPEQ